MSARNAASRMYSASGLQPNIPPQRPWDCAIDLLPGAQQDSLPTVHPGAEGH